LQPRSSTLPRATTDLDLAVVVDATSYASLVAALEPRGLRITRTVAYFQLRFASLREETL
jgi:hypothetical protein